MIEGHGDDLYRYQRSFVSNFSSNIKGPANLFNLKRFIADHLDCISSYPEPEAESLRRDLAEHYRIKETEICVTNGATEAIYLIAQTFANSFSVVLAPTFSEYADACRIHHHQVRLSFLLDAFPESTQIVWLCNPNNPTGKVWDMERLRELIKKLSNILFVIDQSYEDFTDKPLFMPDEIVSWPNAILLHSMTKRFAIPGLRLGYITAHESLISKIRYNRMPWSVNAPAILAGRYLLKNQEAAIDVENNLREASLLSDNLKKLKIIEVWPSDTHILLCRLRSGTAATLKEYLANEHGILIRDASNFEGLDESYFRLAAQTEDENNNLINAIQQWMES